MGATFSRVKTWIAETLTASDLNAEFDNILNNFTPTGMDDDSVNEAAMQGVTDPYPGTTASLATSLSGEIRRIRYLIKQITGEDNWYVDPDTDIATIYKCNSANVLENLGLAASVSTKALTVALKGEDGNDPSATNPVRIGFRSSTLTTGTPVVRTAIAATSVVLSSGSTLGFTAAETGRLYVWAIDNAGAIELALSRTADIFPEYNLVSTTAEGGSGEADSASVMYSTTARTNVACRCIGFIEIETGATEGEWDNAPTKIQVMGPGVHRTGDIIQVVNSSTGEVATGATAIPIDDTIPQKTEGVEILTQEITPTSALNKLRIRAQTTISTVTPSKISSCALFQDDTADALQACSGTTAAEYALLILDHIMTAGTTSATTFKLRGGCQDTTTITINGYNAARTFGGVLLSSLIITEVFA